MAQAKPSKKKKKSGKDEKGKKNEKKAEPVRLPTPIDKRTEARNNVREMLLEAQRMHKDHLLKSKGTKRRSVRGGVSIKRRNRSSSSVEYDPHYISCDSIRIRTKASPECDSRKSLKSSEDDSPRRKDQEAGRKKTSGELVTRKLEDMARRKKSEEFPPKKKEVIVRRKSSADYPVRKREEGHPKRPSEYAARKRDDKSGKGPAEGSGGKKKEGKVSRKGSAEYPVRKKEEFVRRLSSAEYPVRKTARDKEAGMKIKDYHVGVPPFVSLELLDKMKCHNSASSVDVKKGILRQTNATKSREESRQQSGTSVDTKNKAKRKVEEAKLLSTLEADERVKKLRKAVAQSRKNNLGMGPFVAGHAGLRMSPEGPKRTEHFSRNLLSASSNVDSVGAGDPFSSNTSRSYLSSDTDVSKIDRKFMQILEAVTLNQFKVGFDENEHHKLVSEHQKLLGEQQKKLNEEGKEASSFGSETSRPGTAATEVALSERVRKAGSRGGMDEATLKRSPVLKKPEVKSHEKANLGNPVGGSGEERAIKEASSLREEKTRPVKRQAPDDDVRQLWVKDHSPQVQQEKVEEPPRKPEVKQEANPPKVLRRSTPETHEERAPPDDDDSKKLVRRVLDADPLINPTHNYKSAEEKKVEVAKKPEVKAVASKAVSSENATAVRSKSTRLDIKEDARKRVKTWSIIKRLEKAFLTLGLKLEDLDNSDDEDSPTEKKKGPKPAALPKNDVSKRTLTSEASIKASKDKPKIVRKKPERAKLGPTPAEPVRVDKFGAESNGSGDRNLEMKFFRAEKLTGAPPPTPKDKRMRNRAEGGSLAYFTAVNNRLKEGKVIEVRNLKYLEGMGNKKVQEERGYVSVSSQDQYAGSPNNYLDSYYDKKAKNPRKHAMKRPKRPYLDDIQVGRNVIKYKSDYSLSVSCSVSSLSEEGEFKKHKRKKSSPPRRRPVKEVPKEDRWKIASMGKGDDAGTPSDAVEIFNNPRALPKTEAGTEALGSRGAAAAKRNLEFNRMSEANELELRQIRARHKQLISEIKASLDEIRKQHQIYTRIQKETKKFNRDCHMKRKLLASYLRDVKANHEQRARAVGDRPQSSTGTEQRFQIRLERVISSEKYFNPKVGDGLSDYNLHMSKLRKRLQRNPLLYKTERFEVSDSMRSVFGTSNDVSTLSEIEDMESSLLERSTTDIQSSDDTADEYKSFISVISSVQNVKFEGSSARDSAPKAIDSVAERERMKEVLEKPCSSDQSQKSVREIPGYMVQLLEKLNTLIQGQKTQLHNLVMNASGTSNNTSVSDRIRQTGSTNSSGSNLPKHGHNGLEDRTSSERKAASPGHKTSSTSVGKGGLRQHKVKVQGSKKVNHDKLSEPDVVGIPMSKSGALIQGDPGGGSLENILEPEPEIMLVPASNSVGHDAGSGAKNIPNDVQVEEFRYRKGDPSFRFQGSLLECFGEHSSFRVRRTPEEEEALKRRLELERILKHDEASGRQTAVRQGEFLAQEHDIHGGAKGKHSSPGRHRKKSLIIDHNKGEDNEESETVLGHASRHIGANIRQIERKKMAHEYYLKTEKKADARTHTPWRKHDAGRKVGRKFFEEFPFGYFGTPVTFTAPQSSHVKLKDAYCQTDVIDDFDDVDDIYLLDECSSVQSTLG